MQPTQIIREISESRWQNAYDIMKSKDLDSLMVEQDFKYKVRLSLHDDIITDVYLFFLATLDKNVYKITAKLNASQYLNQLPKHETLLQFLLKHNETWLRKKKI